MQVEQGGDARLSTEPTNIQQSEGKDARFGPWIVAQRNGRRPTMAKKGNLGASHESQAKNAATDQDALVTRQAEARSAEKAGSSQKNPQQVHMRSSPIFIAGNGVNTQTVQAARNLASQKTAGSALNEQKSFNPKSKGSRYAALEEDIEEVEMDVSDCGEEGPQSGTHAVEQEEAQIERQGATLDGRMEEDEGVTISVSHAELMDNIRPRCKEGTVQRFLFIGLKGKARKVKAGALNDITNKLDLRPAILKPERSGKRVGPFIQSIEEEKSVFYPNQGI